MALEISKEPDVAFADEKWVRVMCDFCAEGIWAKDGAGVGADELPVSEAIKIRLRDWQRQYEKSDGLSGRRNPASDGDRLRFSQCGLEIAKAIKAELPDWTVIYFDESKCAFGIHQDRSEFEYELTPTQPL